MSKHGYRVNVQDGICKLCFAKAYAIEVNQDPTLSQEYAEECGSAKQSTPSSSQSLSGSSVQEKAKVDLGIILQAVGVQPISFKAWHPTEKKREVETKYREVKDKIKKKLAYALDINISSDEETEEAQKAKDIDCLMNELKLKVKECDYSEKLRLLTLVPQSWTISKTASEFQVPISTVKNSRTLKAQVGILPEIVPKQGRTLSYDVMEEVLKFYNSPENSRECPGIRDCISIGKGEKRQKRLLRLNLDELYALFKQDFPHLKIGRTKFCEARPKWCILPGGSGTHAVCVCKCHQNFKMLTDALKMKKDEYKDLIQITLCPEKTRDCSLRLCPNCPKKGIVEEIIKEKILQQIGERVPFSEDEQDSVEDLSIRYKQWLTTDRVTLEMKEEHLPEFIETVMEQLWQLIPHDFVSKEQADYIKTAQSTLPSHKLVIILDFSENYAFCIQDEIQSHHFNKGACTIHPVTIFFSEEGKEGSQCQILCYISEDLRHDVGFVAALLDDLMSFVKKRFNGITEVMYVSDGCAGQYKNCKNFVNLCALKERYGILASWEFFATSHGKTICDSAGGTVKRCARIESLKRFKAEDIPIDNVNEFLKFCKVRELKGSKIIHRMLELSVIAEARERINALKVPTLPGTRSFHSFTPISDTLIGCKVISKDMTYSLKFDFKKCSAPQMDIKENTFAAFKKDSKWMYVYVKSLNEEEGDVLTVLLIEQGKSKMFDWKDDTEILLPTSDFICQIEVEIIQSGIKIITSGRKIASCLKKKL